MNHTDQHDPESPGILLTPRPYNLMLAVVFGGRRRALDAQLAAASGVSPGDRVLDIGCGPGHLARRLAGIVGPRGHVLGMDASAPMIAYATAHRRRPATCEFQVALGQAMPQPDASIDVITCTFAMHHIPRDARTTALAHMYRVLRPGGRLLIADLHPSGHLTPRLTSALARLARHGAADPQTVDPMADVDIHNYTEPLRELGFTEPTFTDIKPWTRHLTTTKPV
ncbi:MAG: methyltransferase domain-containing protein [Actinophytocola sp.]|uniref:class I SAM-dependent methyltransferase n=1 Tax=Actinophytocola sp. TaxID=1872138 RepID=UPI00132789A4|nr:methyltransferase domain-containing protein [Actinophytocola sp.]MPZ82377.1 methyltransferase domain-containing protein [Actinophytocola sp.]